MRRNIKRAYLSMAGGVGTRHIHFLRMLMCLPLLPVHLLPRGVDPIEERVLREARSVANAICKLTNLVKRHYLAERVGAEV